MPPEIPLREGDWACRVEIYKAYLADLGNIGSRHTEANKFYVSLLSALFVLLGLTIPKEQTIMAATSPGVLPVSLQQWLYLLAIVLSLVWSAQLSVYATLYRAKFCVLAMIEESLPVRPFTLERPALPKYVPVTIVERAVAVLITVPFLMMLKTKHPCLTSLLAACDLLVVVWLICDYVTWFKGQHPHCPTTTA